MPILDARIFSKSFGGKIEILKKGWHRKLKKKKMAHAYFVRPYFSKSFWKSKFRQSRQFLENI